MENISAQKISVEVRRSFLCALLSTLLTGAVVHALPHSEINLFARAAATLVGLFTGAPVFQIEEGWLLPILSQPVVVNEACSGTDFFLIITALLAWHLPRFVQRPGRCIVLALLGAFFLAIMVNALRITCLAQTHYWIIPRLPENYAGFIHMLVGIGIFLSALILLNTTLEYHVRRNPRHNPHRQ